jgi:hypothetical protein
MNSRELYLIKTNLNKPAHYFLSSLLPFLLYSPYFSDRLLLKNKDWIVEADLMPPYLSFVTSFVLAELFSFEHAQEPHVLAQQDSSPLHGSSIGDDNLTALILDMTFVVSLFG